MLQKKRSCKSCYRRKVKCDKGIPCSTCRDQSQVCEYPQEPIRRRRNRALPLRASPQQHETTVKRNSRGESDSRQHSATIITDGDGQSRLVSSDFWANVEDESNLQRAILDESSLDQSSKIQRTPFIFNSMFHQSGQDDGNLNVMGDPRTWSPEHIKKCWELFKKNIDPAVRVLHKPSTDKLVQDAAKYGISSLPPESIALTTAICYAAVVTLHPSHATHHFSENIRVLIRRHQYAIDLAMARANWFHSNHIQVMQALVIVLSCMPRDDNRSLWMYTGLALRMATCLGLHCDTTGLKFRPFQADMRSRLWWHLVLVDVRVSEDYGVESGALRMRSDCPFPLNVNDTDWNIGANSPPVEHEAFTEMSYSLIRFEACRMSLKLYSSQKDAVPDFAEQPLEIVNKLANTIHSKYLRFIDTNSMSPFQKLAFQSSDLLIVKLRLKLNLSGLRDSNLDFSKHYDLFLASIELMETYKEIFLSQDMAGFRWMSEQYTQWHAVAFALSFSSKVLTATPEHWDQSRDSVDRALKAVSFLIGGTQATDSQRWHPLTRLYTRTMDLFEALQSKGGIDESFEATVTTEEANDIELLFNYDFLDFPWQDALEGI